MTCNMIYSTAIHTHATFDRVPMLFSNIFYTHKRDRIENSSHPLWTLDYPFTLTWRLNLGHDPEVKSNNIRLPQPICDKIWPNCAFYDTSMKFSTHLDFIITKIFGYRAISDFALEGIGGHFGQWPP